jgi:hypothetical protein
MIKAINLVKPALVLLTIMGLLVLASTAQARTCSFMEVQGAGSESARAFKTSDGLVTFVADMDVNTDGALDSYLIDDLGHLMPPDNKKVQTHRALNTICNGVNIRTPKHKILYSATSCSKLITEFKRIRQFGWIKRGENYVEFYGIETAKQVPVPGKKSINRGYPCEVGGRYVSQVARSLPGGKYGDCKHDKWLDATKIPAIVISPTAKMKAAGAAFGDVAVVRHLKSGKWIGTVIGDTNMSKVGEVSVNAAIRLTGKAMPGNYRESVALSDGRADYEYVIFPGSRSKLKKLSNQSDPEIQKLAEKLFQTHDLDASKPVCK